jgi:hypothetical protein
VCVRGQPEVTRSCRRHRRRCLLADMLAVLGRLPVKEEEEEEVVRHLRSSGMIRLIFGMFFFLITIYTRQFCTKGWFRP